MNNIDNAGKTLKLSYRPDIDGLRAIAVLLVIGFHLAPGRIPSGFVGVDIFFVISGYLITRIILVDSYKNKFTLLEFYSRRIRRIFPALALVLASTLIFGFFLLTSDDYKYLAKHVVAGVTFSSNLLLLNEAGYFDPSADTKPLLHLWSLAIEEQFYLCWPILILIWLRYVKNKIFFYLIFIISFCLNLYNIEIDPVMTFFSPQTRCFELVAGSIIAVTIPKDGHKFSGQINEILSVTGFFILFFALYTLSPSTKFPGGYVVLPIVATGFIIFSGPLTYLNKIISNKFFVFFGIISYPLYLWHFPVISFVRILYGREVPQGWRLISFFIAVSLAYITYRFVEKPIRGKRGFFITKCLSTIMLLILGAALLVISQEGFDRRERFLPKIKNQGDIGVDKFFHYIKDISHPCTPESIYRASQKWKDLTRCYQSKRGNPTIALVGDSHAEALFLGLTEKMPNENIVFYGGSGVPSLSGKDFVEIYQTVLSDKLLKTVIIAGYWENIFKYSESSESARSINAFQETLKALVAQEKNVFVIEDVPNFSFDPNICKFEGRLFTENKCSEGFEKLNNNFFELRLKFHSMIIENARLHFVKTRHLFCEKLECSMALDGKLFYRDDNHLNIFGSLYVGEYISSFLKR